MVRLAQNLQRRELFPTFERIIGEPFLSPQRGSSAIKLRGLVVFTPRLCQTAYPDRRVHLPSGASSQWGRNEHPE